MTLWRPGSVSPAAKFGLRADRGNRRAQLVRGVADHPAGRFDLPVDPRHEAVQRADQRADFARHGDAQGRQIGRATRRQIAFDPVQRRRATSARQRPPAPTSTARQGPRRTGALWVICRVSSPRARMVWPTTTRTVPLSARSAKRRSIAAKRTGSPVNVPVLKHLTGLRTVKPVIAGDQLAVRAIDRIDNPVVGASASSSNAATGMSTEIAPFCRVSASAIWVAAPISSRS